MVCARTAIGLLAVLLCTAPAQAEIEASLDLRLLDSNGRQSFMDGGLGKLRFDATDDGLNLARALRLARFTRWQLARDGGPVHVELR